MNPGRSANGIAPSGSSAENANDRSHSPKSSSPNANCNNMNPTWATSRSPSSPAAAKFANTGWNRRTSTTPRPASTATRASDGSISWPAHVTVDTGSAVRRSVKDHTGPSSGAASNQRRAMCRTCGSPAAVTVSKCRENGSPAPKPHTRRSSIAAIRGPTSA